MDGPGDGLHQFDLVQSALAEVLAGPSEIMSATELYPASGDVPAQQSPSAYLQHVSRMQQQMAEQFRLAMSGVIEAFREMHRDQMHLVRQELARVRQLSGELHALKAKLARVSAARAMAPRDKSPLPAAPDHAGREPTSLPPSQDGSTAASAIPTPTEPTRPVPAGTASVPQPKPENSGGMPRAGTARSAKSYDEAQVQLMRRLAKLQRERDGRLQKLMRFLGVNRKSL
jgi:hypothetical protein